MEEAGFIKSYHAELAAEKLGYGITVFTQVNLSSHYDSDLDEFRALIKSWPMVRECYLVTGDCDALLKVVAESWENYQKFLTAQLMTAPRVTQVKSTLTLKVEKYEPGIPMSESALKGKH